MTNEYVRKQDALERFYDSISGVPASSVEHVSEYANKMMRRIQNLEPADVAPVVHARWEKYSSITIKCSQCGYVIHDWRYSECKYCPNCGAKMDREEREHVTKS